MSAQTATATNNLLSDALREVAMIGEIRASALGLTRTDKNASRKSEADHQARNGAAKVIVSRLAGADDLHKEICALQAEARDNLHGYSTAWGNSAGRRLLPNANFEPWIRAQARIAKTFEEKVAEIKERAPDLVAQAKANLGAFDIEPPTVEEIGSAYSLHYSLEPIPDGTQFQGSPAVEEWLKKQFERNVAVAYAEAQSDALQRLATPLGNLVERLANYDGRLDKIANKEDPGRHGYFRDSLIENVKQIGSVFQSFNLLGDPKMASIAAQLDLFMRTDAKGLRQDANLRHELSKRAKNILSDLDDMLMPGGQKV